MIYGTGVSNIVNSVIYIKFILDKNRNSVTREVFLSIFPKLNINEHEYVVILNNSITEDIDNFLVKKYDKHNMAVESVKNEDDIEIFKIGAWLTDTPSAPSPSSSSEKSNDVEPDSYVDVGLLLDNYILKCKSALRVKLYPTIISVNKPFTIVVKGNAINETWKQINFNVYAKFGDKVILLNDTSNGIDQKIYGNVILNIDSPDFNKKRYDFTIYWYKITPKKIKFES